MDTQQSLTCAAWLRPETTGATGEPERETSTSPALAVREIVLLRLREVSNLGVIMGVEQVLVACRRAIIMANGWFINKDKSFKEAKAVNRSTRDRKL